jgi:hypothetical protein
MCLNDGNWRMGGVCQTDDGYHLIYTDVTYDYVWNSYPKWFIFSDLMKSTPWCVIMYLRPFTSLFEFQ